MEDTFRQLFKRMIAKNAFIIGNEDLTGLNPLDLPKLFIGTQQIKLGHNFTQLTLVFL